MSINDLGKIRYGEFYIKAWLSIAYVSVKKLIHFFLALIRFRPYCIYMIKIEKNENFKGFLNIFVEGLLVEQVKCRAKALKIASKLCKDRDEKLFSFLGLPIAKGDK